MKVLIPLGTRPEIIKLAPVVRVLRAAGFAVRTVATGQHFDPALTDTFFEDLGVAPDDRWVVQGEEADRVGRILSLAFRELAERQDRKSTRLNSSHVSISYAVFCLKK